MINPANCPLCRKPYLYDQAKKLHVDRYEAVDNSAPGPAAILLQKIIMASADSASTEEVDQVVDEAQKWLATQTGENNAVRNFCFLLPR